MIIIALTYYTYHRHKSLIDDELIENAADELDTNRQKLAEWIEENDPVKKCPVCTYANIRYDWNKITCNDCGWSKDYKVPYQGKMSIARNLNSIIKQVFGRRMADAKNKGQMKGKDLKYLPVELEKFDTGEYTKEQAKFLEKRYKEICDTPHVDFADKDKATVHFLVLQELKLKEIFRKEAIDGTKSMDRDFSGVKKDELNVYDKLQNKLNKIIDDQSKDDTELSLYDKVEKLVESGNLMSKLEEYERQENELKKRISKGKKEREEIIDNDALLEEKLKELEND